MRSLLKVITVMGMAAILGGLIAFIGYPDIGRIIAWIGVITANAALVSYAIVRFLWHRLKFLKDNR